MLSPLLFAIFFAADFLVALQRFSEDPDIQTDLVHLRERPAKVRPETAMEYVRLAVWGMLYADDAGVVSRSPQGLERMIATLVDVFGAFDLTVFEKKTETMSLPLPHVPATPTTFTNIRLPLFTSGARLQKVRGCQPRSTAASVRVG